MPRGGKYVNMPTNVSAEVRLFNEKIVEELHSKKLRTWRKRPLVNPDGYKATMLSAIWRVDMKLTEATPDRLVDSLERLQMKPSTRFWNVQAINEVLVFLGKPGLPNPRPEHEEEVSYLALDTFKRLVSKLPEDQAVYLGSLYATGCRYGELPLAKIDGPWAFISHQIRRDGSTGVTKNKRKRHAAILPPLESFIRAWEALGEAKKAKMRVEGYFKLYGACKRVLGVTIHALRHSYAITCAKEGRSVEEIAGWIGDTVAVAKKHYIGYLKPTKNPWD